MDVDASFSVPSTYISFASIAASDGWVNGDVVDVFVQQSADPTIWAVWTTRWDEANEYLLFDAEQNSQGTLNDSDAVNVTATITKNFANTYEVPELLGGMWTRQNVVDVGAGDTEVVFDIPAGYEAFQITTSGLAMTGTGAATVEFQLSKDGGTTWETGAYHSTFSELYFSSVTSSYAQNQTSLQLTNKQSTLPGSINGFVIVSALGNTSAQAMLDASFTSVAQVGGYYNVLNRMLAGTVSGGDGTGTFDAARIFASSGNSFSTGTVKSWARN